MKRWRWIIKTGILGCMLALLLPGGDSSAQVGELTFSCDAFGLEAALAAGGGPHRFDCTDPTTLTLPTLRIPRDLILDGENRLSFSGGGEQRIFEVPSGVSLELRNLSLQDSQAPTGGAIRVDGGTLLLSNTQIHNSSATDAGGAIFNNGGTVSLRQESVVSGSQAPNGGAIANSAGGNLTLESGSTLSGNRASISGGAIFNASGTVRLHDALLGGPQLNAPNQAPNGAAIFNAGRLLLEGESQLIANLAAENGGAVYNSPRAALSLSEGVQLSANEAAQGGGIYNAGLLTTTGGHLQDHQAAQAGGAIYNAVGASATLSSLHLQGNSAPEGGAIYNAATLTLQQSSLADNHASSAGGAIWNGPAAQLLITQNSQLMGNRAENGGAIANLGGELTLSDSQLGAEEAPNSASNGAGLYQDSAARATLSSSSFTANKASLNGGAIYNAGTLELQAGLHLHANQAQAGGGLANVEGARATLLNSHFSENIAQRGGAIYATAAESTLIRSSVLLRNQAGGSGAGIWNGDGAALRLEEVSLRENRASLDGGGLFNSSGAAAVLLDSVIEGNLAIDGRGGGLFNGGGATLRLSSSFLQANSSGNPAGALLYNDSAAPESSLLQGNCIAPLQNGVFASADADVVQARQNWWGTTQNPLAAGFISGNVNASATLSNPGSPAPNCQPFVGGFLWRDWDSDGQADSDEERLPGVELRLLDSTGQEVAQATTDQRGRFAFLQLEAGQGYRVEVIAPALLRLAEAGSLASVSIGDGESPTIITDLNFGLLNPPAALSFSTEALSIREGESSRYSLSLEREPRFPVEISISSGEGFSINGGQTSTLTFTAENWQQPQSVALQAQEDDRATGERRVALVHSIRSADPDYAALRPPPLALSIADNDRAGLLLDEESLTLAEGASTTYTLRLSSEPAAPVTIRSNADHPRCGVAASAQLDASNWAEGVPLRVENPANDQASGPLDCRISHQLSSADPAYDSLSAPTLQLSLEDDDLVGIRFSESSLGITEGESASYRLALSSEPSAPVQLSVSTSDSACVISTPSSLDASNWAQGVSITVEAAQDEQVSGEKRCDLSHRLSSDDPNYDAISVPGVQVSIAEDDRAGLVVEASSSNLTEGALLRSQLRLTSQPQDSVRVIVKGDEHCTGTSIGTLTPQNWAEGIPLNLRAYQDDIANGPRPCQLSFTLSSRDTAYAQLPATALPSLELTVLDDDEAGALLHLEAPARESLALAEPAPLREPLQLMEGGSSTYTVSLSSEPTAPVTLLASSDADFCSLRVRQQLDASNWKQGIEVQIISVQDAIVTGERGCSISHRFRSADPAYDGLDSLPTVQVLIAEDDRAGIVLSETALRHIEGGSSTYTVSLSSEPTAPVTVLPQPGEGCSAAVSAALSSENWRQGVRVTVSSPQNQIAEGNRDCEVQHLLSSNDPIYQQLRAPSTRLTIQDNDSAGVILPASPISLSEGESASYPFALRSQPQSPVTLEVFSDSAACSIRVAATLDASNWQSGVSVTVQGLEDSRAAGDHTCLLSHRLRSADAAYNLGPALLPALEVRVQDRDQPGLQLDAPASTRLQEGDSTRYLLRLESEPLAPVSVSVSSDSARCSARGGTVDARNWQAGLPIVVTTVDDSSPQLEESCTLRLMLESTDPGYAALTGPTLSLSLLDNDPGEARLSVTALELSEGSSNSYSLRLTLPPTAPVRVEVSSSSPDCSVTVAEALDSSNWQSGVSILVNNLDDDMFTGAQQCIISHRLQSEDPRYQLAAEALAQVVVTVRDNEEVVLLAQPSDLSLTEGGSASYQLQLRQNPGARVRVIPSVTEGDCQIRVADSLTPENWEAGISVELSVPENFIAEGTRSCSVSHRLQSANAAFSSLPPLSLLSITVRDNDSAGLLLDAERLRLEEGSSASYRLRLSSQPQAPVAVRISADSPDCNVVPQEVLLQPAQWQQGLPIRVSASDNTRIEDSRPCTLTHQLSSDDTTYNSLPPTSLLVTVVDNDSPAPVFTGLRQSITEGQSTRYSIALNFAPTAPVEVLPSSSDACRVSVSGSLNADNWETGIEILVESRDDARAQGEALCRIAHQFRSQDERYNISSGDVPPALITLLDNDSAGVAIGAEMLALTEGDSATYTLRLESDPLSPVSLSVRSDNDSCELHYDDRLDASNWQAGLSVEVSIPQDAQVQGERICTLRHSLQSADAAYTQSAEALATVRVVVADDDRAGFVLEDAPSDLLEGESASYTLRLSSEPSSVVSVLPTVTPNNCTVVVEESLNADNWASGIAITVSTTDDFVVNPLITCTVSHLISTTDPAYFAQSIPALQINVRDDDAAALQLSRESLVLQEGASDSYRVRLASEPTAPVTLSPLAPGACSTDATSYTLDSGNWNTGVLISVQAAEDDLAQAERSCIIDHSTRSSDANYNLGAAVLPNLTISLVDNDRAGVEIGVATLTQTEGSSNSYTIALQSEPIASVFVTVSSSSSVCQVRVAEPITAANWQSGVAVTVSSQDNALVEADRSCLLSHSLSSADPNYDVAAAALANVRVSVRDNDEAGLRLSRDSFTLDEGETAIYRLALESEPRAPVTVRVASSNELCSISMIGQLSPGNWQTGIRIEVRTPDDNTWQETRTCTLTHSLRSEDPDYNAEDTLPLRLTILDNEPPAVLLSTNTLTLEEGESASYTLSLLTRPEAPVIVEARPLSDACTVAPLPLLAPQDWESGLRLTVAATDNTLYERDSLCIIQHQIYSTDARYNQLSPVDEMAVTVLNDDLLLLVEPRSLTLAEGESGRYSLRLSTAPPAPVSLRLSSPDANCRFSPTSFVFDATNWDRGTSITLSPLPDDTVLPGRGCFIEHRLSSSSADFSFGTQALPAVAVAITDRDRAGLSASSEVLTLREGESSSYTLRLSSIPLETVTVRVASNSPDCQALVGGVLNATNWQTGIVVTVSSPDNADQEPDRECQLSHSLSSTDPNYRQAAADLPIISVRVEDEDQPGIALNPAELRLTEGTTGSYIVTLDTPPDRRVLLEVSSDSPDCTAQVAGSLSTANWERGVEVRVQAVDDERVSGERHCSLQHRLGSDDPAYLIPAENLPSLRVSITEDDEAGASADPSTLALEEGTAGTYRLRLSSEPAAPVQVAVIADAAACQGRASDSLNAENWQTGIEIQLRVQDNARLGENPPCTLRHQFSSEDEAYNFTALPVQVQPLDNDSAGVELSQPMLSITEGESARYRLRLSSEPSAPVSLSASSSAGCRVEGSAILNADNWQTGAGLNVIVEDDQIIAPRPACVITHTLQTEDADYARLTALPTLQVDIIESDTARLLLLPPALSLPEGGNAIYVASLVTEPLAPVTLTVSSQDAGCSASVSGVLDSDTWDTGITVSISAAEDAIADDTRRCLFEHRLRSSDPSYRLDADALPNLSAAVQDNDSAGVSLSVATFSITEGESASYQLRLSSQPRSPVTLTASSSHPACVVQVTGPLDPANWQEGLSVSVESPDDAQARSLAPCVISHQLSSADASYSLTPAQLPQLAVHLRDNDRAGLELSSPSLELGEGERGSYQLRLGSQPLAPVRIMVQPSEAACRILTPLPLLVLPSQWGETLSVEVEAVDDQRHQEGLSCELRHILSSQDAAYQNLEGGAASLLLNITDNDSPAILSDFPPSLRLLEGESATYTLQLATEPSAPVDIVLNSSDPACTLSPARLRFSAENALAGQAVTLSNNDDAIARGERSCTIEVQVSTEDSAYQALSLPPWTLTLEDDDIAGVIIEPLALEIPAGGSGSYTLRLSSQPSAPARVNIIPSTALCQVSSGGLLNAENWASGIRIEVQVAAEAAAEGLQSCTITHFNLSSTDATYALGEDSLPPVEITITEAAPNAQGRPALSFAEGAQRVGALLAPGRPH